jgi:hypothetical protein
MFRMTKMFLAGAAMAVATQAAPVVYGTHTYDLIRANGITWADAQAAASALGTGWHLATITSSAEQSFITGSVVGSSNPGEFWLGGVQDGFGQWTWVTGETWGYTNWNPGEPNDNYGPGSENHLATWGSGTWRWNDEGNLGNITGYIVEHSPEAVPEPGTMALMGLGLLGVGMAYRRNRKA